MNNLEKKFACVIGTGDIGYVLKVDEKGLALVSFGTSGEKYIPVERLIEYSEDELMC